MYLWSACSTDHLQYVGFAVLLTGSTYVVHGGFDHHQVSWQVHTHRQSAGGD